MHDVMHPFSYKSDFCTAAASMLTPFLKKDLVHYYVYSWSHLPIIKTFVVLPLHIYFFSPEPYIPYTIDVSAATHAGEGDVNTIIDFTEEGSKYTSNTKAFQPKTPRLIARNYTSSLSPEFPPVGTKTACMQTDKYVLRG